MLYLFFFLVGGEGIWWGGFSKRGYGEKELGIK